MGSGLSSWLDERRFRELYEKEKLDNDDRDLMKKWRRDLTKQMKDAVDVRNPRGRVVHTTLHDTCIDTIADRPQSATDVELYIKGEVEHAFENTSTNISQTDTGAMVTKMCTSLKYSIQQRLPASSTGYVGQAINETHVARDGYTATVFGAKGKFHVRKSNDQLYFYLICWCMVGQCDWSDGVVANDEVRERMECVAIGNQDKDKALLDDIADTVMTIQDSREAPSASGSARASARTGSQNRRRGADGRRST